MRDARWALGEIHREYPGVPIVLVALALSILYRVGPNQPGITTPDPSPPQELKASPCPITSTSMPINDR